jgi:hypothetical protein
VVEWSQRQFASSTTDCAEVVQPPDLVHCRPHPRKKSHARYIGKATYCRHLQLGVGFRSKSADLLCRSDSDHREREESSAGEHVGRERGRWVHCSAGWSLCTATSYIRQVKPSSHQWAPWPPAFVTNSPRLATTEACEPLGQHVQAVKEPMRAIRPRFVSDMDLCRGSGGHWRSTSSVTWRRRICSCYSLVAEGTRCYPRPCLLRLQYT